MKTMWIETCGELILNMWTVRCLTCGGKHMETWFKTCGNMHRKNMEKSISRDTSNDVENTCKACGQFIRTMWGSAYAETIHNMWTILANHVEHNIWRNDFEHVENAIQIVWKKAYGNMIWTCGEFHANHVENSIRKNTQHDVENPRQPCGEFIQTMWRLAYVDIINSMWTVVCKACVPQHMGDMIENMWRMHVNHVENSMKTMWRTAWHIRHVLDQDHVDRGIRRDDSKSPYKPCGESLQTMCRIS